MLAAAFLGLLFDGVELGLMPIASLSVSKRLLGDQFTEKLGGEWFAWFSASLLFGAAIGGIVLGNLGDRIGRTRAMGVSILFYSVFAGLGAFAKTQEQMLILRFLVGLGVGGVWPNGMTLVSECWPNASRPLVSGVMSAGLNAGILMLSQLARFKPITPESWQWIFQLAAAPAILGLLVMILLPESPRWLASRLAQSSSATDTTSRSKSKVRIGELFAADLRRMTLFGIVLSSVPMVGAWAASKWMIPWAEAVAGKVDPGYKAATQGWWAVGATLGSFFGAQLAHWFGRKRSYLLISLGSTAITVWMFLGTAPLRSGFHAIVFIQGLVATLFFGWLAVYLPELFPLRVRATGSGLAYNFGRFATAAGVFFAGMLFSALGSSYPHVGASCASIYALGIVAIWFAPDTSRSMSTESPVPPARSI